MSTCGWSRPGCWGAALQYFTGSQAHNVAVGEIAVRRKLKLSEYGLFDASSGDLIVTATEEEVYARLGMAWVPPESGWLAQRRPAVEGCPVAAYRAAGLGTGPTPVQSEGDGNRRRAGSGQAR